MPLTRDKFERAVCDMPPKGMTALEWIAEVRQRLPVVTTDADGNVRERAGRAAYWAAMAEQNAEQQDTNGMLLAAMRLGTWLGFTSATITEPVVNQIRQRRSKGGINRAEKYRAETKQKRDPLVVAEILKARKRDARKQKKRPASDEKIYIDVSERLAVEHALFISSRTIRGIANREKC